MQLALVIAKPFFDLTAKRYRRVSSALLISSSDQCKFHNNHPSPSPSPLRDCLQLHCREVTQYYTKMVHVIHTIFTAQHLCCATAFQRLDFALLTTVPDSLSSIAASAHYSTVQIAATLPVANNTCTRPQPGRLSKSDSRCRSAVAVATSAWLLEGTPQHGAATPGRMGDSGAGAATPSTCPWSLSQCAYQMATAAAAARPAGAQQPPRLSPGLRQGNRCCCL